MQFSSHSSRLYFTMSCTSTSVVLLRTFVRYMVTATIGGHKPPGHNPLGQNPPVSGKAGRNPEDITPCRIRKQCTMSFSVTGKGVLKAKFQDWPILKFSFQVGDVWFCGFYPALPLNGGLWPIGGGGYVRGGYVRSRYCLWGRDQFRS